MAQIDWKTGNRAKIFLGNRKTLGCQTFVRSLDFELKFSFSFSLSLPRSYSRSFSVFLSGCGENDNDDALDNLFDIIDSNDFESICLIRVERWLTRPGGCERMVLHSMILYWSTQWRMCAYCVPYVVLNLYTWTTQQLTCMCSVYVDVHNIW